MRKYIRYLVTMSMICFLMGCGKEISTNETTANEVTSNAQEDNVTGHIKVSVDYVSEEQLLKYEKVNEFVINEEGISLLILPTEELTNFSINSIAIDENTNEFITVSKLHEIPLVTSNEPVLIKLYMPDFPCIGISYTDESGMIQECGIEESLEDGSLSLFEMYTEGAINK